MILDEKNELGQQLFQCDHCGKAGVQEEFFIEDNFQHFCASCRLGFYDNLFEDKAVRFAEI